MTRLIGLIVACVLALAMPVHAPVHADEAIIARFKAHAAGSKVVVDHAAWNALLASHLVVGADGINRLAYNRLKGEPAAAVKRYIKALEGVAVESLDRPEQQAYWVNLYNAVTLDTVLERYPVKSIYDIDLKDANGTEHDGPWKAKLTTIGGVALSLEDIETVIVQPIFKDVRAHYVLNCLSIGCPNLQPVALTGANLEATYEAAARAFVNHPRAISFGADGKVTASSIYDWFAGEFGGFAGVVAHMKRYAGAELAAKLSGLKAIDVYTYDWGLADAAP